MRKIEAIVVALLLCGSGSWMPLFGVSIPGILRKVDAIVVPLAEFKGASLADAVQTMCEKAKQLDPTGEGISLIGFDLQKAHAPITVSYRNFRFLDALKGIAQAAGYDVRVDPFACVIFPKGHRAIPDVIPERLENVERALAMPVPITLKSASVEEAVEALRSILAKEDPSKAARIVFRANAREKVAGSDRRITFATGNIPPIEFCRYLCEHTQLFVRVGKEMVVIDAR